MKCVVMFADIPIVTQNHQYDFTTTSTIQTIINKQFELYRI